MTSSQKLSDMKDNYQVVYADPPWRYRSKSPTTSKRPSGMGVSLTPDYYYKTMSLGDIKNLPVGEITDSDGVCFLWTTNPMLREGLEVLEAWGFEYITTITWHKTNGKGPGYWFRGHTEHLLFGKKGKVKSFRSMISNFQAHKTVRHSEKPALFRRIIETVTPTLNPKIELFARERCSGWSCWGHETGTVETTTLEEFVETDFYNGERRLS